jgi:hypothetical protein
MGEGALRVFGASVLTVADRRGLVVYGRPSRGPGPTAELGGGLGGLPVRSSGFRNKSVTYRSHRN